VILLGKVLFAGIQICIMTERANDADEPDVPGESKGMLVDGE